jgi:hypothetical protein
LRYLQTLAEIGTEQSTVVVFPLPLDLIQPFLDISAKSGHQNGQAAEALRNLKPKVVPAVGTRAPRAKAD